MLMIVGYGLGVMMAAGVLFAVVWFVFGRGEISPPSTTI